VPAPSTLAVTAPEAPPPATLPSVTDSPAPPSTDDQAAQLAAALSEAGIVTSVHGAGLHADAEALQVGKVAAAHQITLVELRPNDGGLEDLFLQLTADDQRDDLTEGAAR
jgi:hypothetical protein